MGLETIPQIVLGNSPRFGSAPAYHVRGPGGWEATSWSDYAAEVRRAGAALVALGVEPGQAVTILGANRPEWVICDVAAMAAGAVPARGDGGDGPFEARLGGLRPDGVGTYIYTSGTTGRPKAVMLTHDTLSWTAAQAADLAEARQSDRLLSYLPLSHVAEQMFTIHIAAVTGIPVYFAESLDKLVQ